MNNIIHKAQLLAVAKLTDHLTAIDRKVIAYHFNGKEPVVLIDRPLGEGISSVMVREPDGRGGHVRRHQAQRLGVRVEWHEHEPAEVANG